MPDHYHPGGFYQSTLTMVTAIPSRNINSLKKAVICDHSNLSFNSETLNEIKSLNLNQLGCSYADATIIIDDEEKVSGNIMKSKIFKDSKTCSTVDLTKSEGDYSALLDEIERVIKSL